MAERVAPSAQVNHYTQAALADNTHRSYKADLAHFRAHGGTIPTTAIKLAEYLASPRQARAKAFAYIRYCCLFCFAIRLTPFSLRSSIRSRWTSDLMPSCQTSIAMRLPLR